VHAPKAAPRMLQRAAFSESANSSHAAFAPASKSFVPDASIKVDQGLLKSVGSAAFRLGPVPAAAAFNSTDVLIRSPDAHEQVRLHTIGLFGVLTLVIASNGSACSCLLPAHAAGHLTDSPTMQQLPAPCIELNPFPCHTFLSPSFLTAYYLLSCVHCYSRLPHHCCPSSTAQCPSMTPPKQSTVRRLCSRARCW
jgi:hypothetical protein